MGLDPDDDDYDEGVECATCVDVSFDGVTPLYVWVHVSGVENCGVLNFAYNGSFKLEQTANPCIWSGAFTRNGQRGSIEYKAAPTSSVFMSWIDPWVTIFHGVDVDPCIDEFDNILVCAPAVCHNGRAIVTWGPDDPCGS